MSEGNSNVVNKAVAGEMNRFVICVEKMTTLKRPEIVCLAKIYGLGDFFQEYAERIIEKKLGSPIAEIVLSILKLKKIRAEYMEGINKSAKDNSKLTNALRKWIMNDDPESQDKGGYHETRPEPPEAIEQDEECLADMEVENE